MNRNVWRVAVPLVMVGFGVWDLSQERYGWALLNFGVAIALYVLLGTLESVNRGPVKVATDLAEPPVAPLAALLRNEGLDEHVANCALCRDFWRDDR
jgi:hypothetical protein